LLVRDAASIGEIQICPRCGSMVLVEPPPGWNGPPEDQPPIATPEVAAELSAQPPGEFGSNEADAEDLLVEPPPVPAADLEPAVSDPILPTDAWTSQGARQRQQWLMLGGAATMGVALSFGLMGFLAFRAANKLTAENPAGPLAAEPLVVDRSSLPPAPPAEPTPVAKPAPSAVAPELQAAPALPIVDRPAAGTEALVGDAGDEPLAESVVSQPGQAPDAAPSVPPQTAKATQPKEISLDPGSLSETLQAFAPFIDPDAARPPERMDTAEQDVSALDPQAVTTEQPTVPRPEPRQIDLDARLQDKIAEVEFADVPLKNVLRFMMNFSTIPISVDPDALALVRATPRTPVTVQATDATVDQLLNAALKPLQLAHVAVGRQLVVTRPPVPDGGLRTIAHGVSDLVGNDPDQLARLAELIVEMVEPASWEAAGGAGVIREELPSLVIQQQETVLLRAIVFCERLRAARGLPPQSKFSPDLFSLEPRWAQSAKRLAAPVTLNFLQPTAFTRILDRLGAEGGMEILVDWQALTELGWLPETETTVTANEQPFGGVLIAMLQPMDLTYRILDAGMVQVTSPAAAEARWDIEFYPVPTLPATDETPDAFVTRLRTALTGGNPAALTGVLVFDAPSRHLIAALPQGQQRKLAEFIRGTGG
jgi:hypothetical protein